MIEVYKIVTNKYDHQVVPNIPMSGNVITRGNTLKLETVRFKHDMRKYAFTSRIINLWNSLPENVVKADSTNSFKNRLDKYWTSEDVIYNYEADILSRTGSAANIS